MAPRRPRRQAPKRAAVKRAGLRKSAAIRRAGGRRKYASKIIRYNTMAGLLTNSIWMSKGRKLPFRVRAMKAVAAPDIYQANYGQVVQVGNGVQKFVSFASLTGDQLNTIANKTPAGAPNRVLIENCQTEVTFTNTTNAALEVEVYDIVPKRDVFDEMYIKTDNGTYPWSYIEDAIEAGCLAGAQLSPAASSPANFIGASPFDSQIFKAYFAVAKRAHVMLASGASHRHQQMVGTNKLIDQSVIAGASALGGSIKTYIKGYTYATLLLVRGVAAYNPSAEPAGDATTNGAFLNVVTSVRVKYTFVTDNTNTLNYTNVLTTGVPNVRNIGSGAYEALSP